MTDPTTELAVHGERITVLQGSVSELRDDFKGMREDVHAIRLMLSEVRGGWKVSMRVAAVAGAIAALIAEAFLRKVG